MAIIWDSKRVADGLAITRDARAGTLTYLRELLDDYHGVRRSEAYYDLVAGDWLDKCLHLTYAGWQRVLAGESPRAHMPVRIIGDVHSFTEASCHTALQDGWHSAVERLLNGDSPAHWTFDQREVRISNGGTNWSRRFLKRTVGSSRPAMIFCRPYVKCTRRDWMAALWRWRRWAQWDDFDYPLNVVSPIDQEWRRATSAMAAPARDFPGLVRAMLPLHIPAALLEGFCSLRDALLALGLCRPRAVYTANGLHGHLTFKLLAAEWQMEGTRVLSHQHGGGFGLERVHVVEDYETRVADCFYSWGWRRSDRPVRPMSAPSPARYHGTAQRILLMCCSYPTTMYRLHYQPSPGTIETVAAHTAAFLSALAENDALLIRLTASHEGLKQQAPLQAAFTWAAFDEQRPSVFQRYAESWVVVHNYLGTSWLETLAMDIPTVCFFDPDIYVFRAEAEPYISAMEKAGILFRSGADAGRFVAGLQNDPEGWWKRGEVQNARRAFVEHYANFSQDWTTQWEQEFGSLL